MCLKQNQKLNSNKGFTLIEILLGLMIFAVISLTLYNTFWLGLKIDHKANEINRTYQEARVFIDLLSRDLENAFVYDFSSSYPDQVSFKGTSKELMFLLTAQQGLSMVRYYLDLPNQGKLTHLIIAQRLKAMGKKQGFDAKNSIDFLMRQETSLVEYLAQSNNTAEPEIIAAGIKKGALKLQYGLLKQDGSGQVILPKLIEWKNEWKEAGIPAAVRVQIELFDTQNPLKGIILSRDIYLPEISAEQVI